MSRAAVAAAETGEKASLEMIAGLARALRLDIELEIVDRQRRERVTARQGDPVHAAMGEFEVRLLGAHRYPVAVDEPYQHYQFAGRADVVAWDMESLAMLHVENRTQFPNVQDSLGSYNAKRAYLGRVLAERLGIPGFRSETHAIICLWSAEVLHSLRLHAATFRATCPDPPERIATWLDGQPPTRGKSSSLVVLDPFATGRQRRWVDLETALASARPRYSGYADAAERARGGAERARGGAERARGGA